MRVTGAGQVAMIRAIAVARTAGSVGIYGSIFLTAPVTCTRTTRITRKTTATTITGRITGNTTLKTRLDYSAWATPHRIRRTASAN